MPRPVLHVCPRRFRERRRKRRTKRRPSYPRPTRSYPDTAAQGLTSAIPTFFARLFRLLAPGEPGHPQVSQSQTWGKAEILPQPCREVVCNPQGMGEGVLESSSRFVGSFGRTGHASWASSCTASLALPVPASYYGAPSLWMAAPPSITITRGPSGASTSYELQKIFTFRGRSSSQLEMKSHSFLTRWPPSPPGTLWKGSRVSQRGRGNRRAQAG